MQIYYLLKCNRCKWFRKCKGTTEELKDLVEHKSCANCHGPRKFKCPECVNIVKSMRVEQPDLPEIKENIPSSTPAAPMESLAKELGKLLARRIRGVQ